MNEKWISPQVENIGDLETNLGGVVEYVFNQPPAKPFSFRLELDHPVPPGQNPGDYHRELLVTLMLMGIKYLYGEISPFSLNETQFSLIEDYMISFGYVPKVIRSEDGTPIDVHFVQYQYH